MSLLHIFSRPKVEKQRGYAEDGLGIREKDEKEKRGNGQDESISLKLRKSSSNLARQSKEQAQTTPRSYSSASFSKSSTRHDSTIAPPFRSIFSLAIKVGPALSCDQPDSRSISGRKFSHDKASFDRPQSRRSSRTPVGQDAIPPVLIRRIFCLTRTGHLLQYADRGLIDRAPEQIQAITRDTYVVASDLIHGRPYVLHVVEPPSNDDYTRPESNSFLSKLGFTKHGSNKKKTACLIILENASEMEEWMTVIRKEIQTQFREYSPISAIAPRLSVSSHATSVDLWSVPERNAEGDYDTIPKRLPSLAQKLWQEDSTSLLFRKGFSPAVAREDSAMILSDYESSRPASTHDTEAIIGLGIEMPNTDIDGSTSVSVSHDNDNAGNAGTEELSPKTTKGVIPLRLPFRRDSTSTPEDVTLHSSNVKQGGFLDVFRKRASVHTSVATTTRKELPKLRSVHSLGRLKAGTFKSYIDEAPEPMPTPTIKLAKPLWKNSDSGELESSIPSISDVSRQISNTPEISYSWSNTAPVNREESESPPPPTSFSGRSSSSRSIHTSRRTSDASLMTPQRVLPPRLPLKISPTTSFPPQRPAVIRSFSRPSAIENKRPSNETIPSTCSNDIKTHSPIQENGNGRPFKLRRPASMQVRPPNMTNSKSSPPASIKRPPTSNPLTRRASTPDPTLVARETSDSQKRSTVIITPMANHSRLPSSSTASLTNSETSFLPLQRPPSSDFGESEHIDHSNSPSKIPFPTLSDPCIPKSLSYVIPRRQSTATPSLGCGPKTTPPRPQRSSSLSFINHYNVNLNIQGGSNGGSHLIGVALSSEYGPAPAPPPMGPLPDIPQSARSTAKIL